MTAGGDPPVAPAIETLTFPTEGSVHVAGRALRGGRPGRPADPDPARGRGRQPARHRADLRGAGTARRRDATRPRQARLARPSRCPTSGCPTRAADPGRGLRRAGWTACARRWTGAATTGCVIYADREHSANLAWLTGFDPRFEEAIADRRPDRRAARSSSATSASGTAGAAPLPMRRHLFQDLSLPGPAARSIAAAGRDPRRRGRSGRDDGSGSSAGRRTPTEPAMDTPAYPRRRAAPADRRGRPWSRTPTDLLIDAGSGLRVDRTRSSSWPRSSTPPARRRTASGAC